MIKPGGDPMHWARQQFIARPEREGRLVAVIGQTQWTPYEEPRGLTPQFVIVDELAHRQPE